MNENKINEKEIKDELWDKEILLNDCVCVKSGKSKKVEDGEYVLYGSTGIIGKTNDNQYSGKLNLIARVGSSGLNFYLDASNVGITDNTLIVESNEAIINPKYLFYFLVQCNLQKLSFGSSQPLITSTQIKNIKIMLPEMKKQDKIVNLLSSIDDLIAHNEERARNIKKEKEFITAKLITNSNDLDTSIKTIGDILYIPQKDEANNVDMTKILRLGLHTKGLSTLAEDNTLLSGGTKYYYRKAGDFIFGKQNIFNGSVGIIPNKYDNYLSSGDVPTLRFKDDAETYFFMHFVSRKNFYNGLEIFANGTGSKRIHEKDLLNIKIKYPNNRKQIANLLSTMDENINLINERVNNLKVMKQHYLNIIFK